MMTYFSIMRSSYGAISIEYLEKLTLDKLFWIERAARAADLTEDMMWIHRVSRGFHGMKGSDKFRREENLRELLYSDPKTDVEKLKKWKGITRKAKKKKTSISQELRNASRSNDSI